MIGRVTRYLTWGRWPESTPPPQILGVEIAEMRVRNFNWPGLGDVTRAEADARSFVTRLVDGLEPTGDGEPAEPVYLCLRSFADREGQGITRDALWPYWAVAGAAVAKGLAEVFALPGRTLGGIVIHSEDRRREDGRLDRELRDSRLEAAIIGPCRQYFPEALITGYGVRHAPSSSPSMSAGYGRLEDAVFAYGGLMDPRPPIPWLPRCGWQRVARGLEGLRGVERLCEPVDLAAQIVAAAEQGAETAILWGHDNDPPDRWAATWKAIEMLPRPFSFENPGHADVLEQWRQAARGNDAGESVLIPEAG